MELRVLGGIEVVVDGRERPLGGPKQRLLLAALLVHRRSVVPVDLLEEVMWGEAPPPTARATLLTHLSKVRQTLGGIDGVELRNVAPGYALEVDPDLVDADRFEAALTQGRELAARPDEALAHLEAALSHWRGPAFAEFADASWAQGEAARLEELRLVALEERAEAQLLLGRHAVVVGELGSLVARHPFRERLWGQLMLALHRSGRQGEALRVAHELRRNLRDELGLDPSAALAHLEHAIAADDPSLQLTEVAAPTPVAVRRPADLPTMSTALVGRDGDLTSLAKLLPESRLLTLVGPGGVGKSSLAITLAQQQTNVDVVVFVELAPVRDEAAVVAAVARVLDVERRLDRSLEESVLDVLGAGELLLVLDNCEHVLETIGSLVQRIIRWCPGVRLVATSREPIGMAGETVWPVLPLEVPESVDASPEAIAGSPAVQVFTARAQEAWPAFEITGATAGAVAELCIQLDGVPLALELAAARMASMTPAQLASRLHDRFVVLGSGHARDARHRSLLDLVQWSYELLSPTEQALFDRLSVFVGGFDLDAAEAACGVAGLSPGDVARSLSDLVGKSLVIADHGDDAVRFRQLETLRQYGSDRLATRPEAPLVHRAHVTTMVALSERAAVAMDGRDEAAGAAQLDAEIGNLRAALSSALDVGNADAALRLVCAAREWAFRRMRYEIVGWAESAVAADGAWEHELLPTAMGIVSYGRFVRGELARAVELAGAAVDARNRLGGTSCGLPERVLANALFYLGDKTTALSWMDEMVAVAVASGVDARVAHGYYMRSVAQTSIGDPAGGAALARESTAAAARGGSGSAASQSLYATALALASERPEEAEVLLDRSADEAGAAGNRWMRSFALTEVLWLRSRRGETAAALQGYAEVVETWYRGGDWANQWLSLRQLAGTLATAGRDEEAALLLGAVEAAGASTALPFAPSDADELHAITREFEARLGAAAMEQARRRGGGMRDDMVVNAALEAIAAACLPARLPRHVQPASDPP